MSQKVDTVIDLAASSPEHRDVMNERLGRLRLERREIEARLRELEVVPVRTANPDEIVDSILENLADAQRLFNQGPMDERKRVVRAFVEGLTLCASSRTGEMRIRELPVRGSLGTGSCSVKSLAGAGFEPATFGL